MMKTYLSFIFLFLGIQGCLEYDFTTRVHRDGSLERTLVIKGDSSDVLHQKVLCPLDSTWESVFRKDTGDCWILTLTRSFKNVREMNCYFYGEPDTGRLFLLKVTLKRKFRWFYTYFDYRETMLSIHPFRKVPVEKYLSHEELCLLATSDDETIGFTREQDKLIKIREDSAAGKNMTRADSLRMQELWHGLERRFMIWLQRSAYEEFFQELYYAVARSRSKCADTATLSANKEKVWSLIEKEVQGKKGFGFFLDSNDSLMYDYARNGGEDYVQLVLNDFSDLTGIECLKDLREISQNAFEIFRKKCSENNYVFDVSFHLYMPGLLLSTNSDNIKGNEVIWEVPDTVQWADFKMQAESRTINRWAFYVTGIIILLFFLSIAGRLFRKNSRF